MRKSLYEFQDFYEHGRACIGIRCNHTKIPRDWASHHMYRDQLYRMTRALHKDVSRLLELEQNPQKTMSTTRRNGKIHVFSNAR